MNNKGLFRRTKDGGTFFVIPMMGKDDMKKLVKTDAGKIRDILRNADD